MRDVESGDDREGLELATVVAHQLRRGITRFLKEQPNASSAREIPVATACANRPDSGPRSGNRPTTMTPGPMGPREAARGTGVSTDTLRHYERTGLLLGVTRTTAGYRRYSAAMVHRVLLIQRALVVGFSLADLKQVLRERDKGGAPSRGVRALVRGRPDEMDRRIEELIALRGELRLLLQECDVKLAKTPPGQQAHLLDTLLERPSGTKPPHPADGSTLSQRLIVLTLRRRRRPRRTGAAL